MRVQRRRRKLPADQGAACCLACARLLTMGRARTFARRLLSQRLSSPLPSKHARSQEDHRLACPALQCPVRLLSCRLPSFYGVFLPLYFALFVLPCCSFFCLTRAFHFTPRLPAASLSSRSFSSFFLSFLPHSCPGHCCDEILLDGPNGLRIITHLTVEGQSCSYEVGSTRGSTGGGTRRARRYRRRCRRWRPRRCFRRVAWGGSEGCL